MRKAARSGQSSFPCLETCGVRKWGKMKEKTQGKRLAFVFMAREVNEKYKSQTHLPLHRVTVGHNTAGEQPASPSWCRAPTEAHDQIHHVSVRRPRVLIFWYPLPNERVGLSLSSVTVFVSLFTIYMYIYRIIHMVLESNTV